MAIRTPDQRLRVFVSSTLGELTPERQAVRAAIERLRLTLVMFEQGAGPHPPRALYRATVEAAAAAFEGEADPFYDGIAQLSRAYVARLAGRIDGALALAKKAYDASRDVGEWYVRAIARTLLAGGALVVGDNDRARRYALEALIGARNLHNVSAAAYALVLMSQPIYRSNRAATERSMKSRFYRSLVSVRRADRRRSCSPCADRSSESCAEPRACGFPPIDGARWSHASGGQEAQAVRGGSQGRSRSADPPTSGPLRH